MVLVGLLYAAAIYPIVMALRHPTPSDDTGDTMMMSLYFTLGITRVEEPTLVCNHGVLVLRHLPADEVARILNFGMDGLLVPQCHDGIEPRRAARRDVAGGEGDERQQKGDFQKCDGIAGADAEKQTSEQARER